MKLDNVLNQQEVIERKVKELNQLINHAVDYGIKLKIDTMEHNSIGGKKFTQVLVDFKINPKDLK